LKVVFVLAVVFSVFLLMAEPPDSLVQVTIEGDTLIARIDIPEGMHLAKQVDFVYVEIDSIGGVTFGETIWPKGGKIDELGILNYEDELVLQRKIMLSESAIDNEINLKIYVGYQMCFDAYCLPPNEVEFELAYKPAEK
jgi:hypothetical protein